MDETSISAENGKFSAIVPAEAKSVIRKEQGHFNHHMTLIMCIAADGENPVKLTVILPLATLPKLSERAYPSYNFAGSETRMDNG
jgi:hypothetical protein